MTFYCVDDIQDREKRYAEIVALSFSATGAPWNLLDSPPQRVSIATYLLGTTALAVSSAEELFAVGDSKPNPAKESLIKQIENIPSHRDFYDADETPPDQGTRNDARKIILGVSPSGVLAGADVYGYYGGVNICWETPRRKIKLVIPPHASGGQPTLYHGQMQDGSVMESDIEPNADSKLLRTWLDWLQG